jgi:hypothetical protein
MRDELTVPASQRARDPVASLGPAGARDFADVPGSAADRAAPTTVIGRLGPSTASPLDTSMGPLDIKALLHPSEHSRLLIALSSSAVVFGFLAMMVYARQGWVTLVLYAGGLAAFGVAVWLSLQIVRSRLLGGAVRVSDATLPELQSVFDEVRARLDYHRRVDAYVRDKVDGGSVMTSYLGTRLIEIDGGLAADLLDNERHAELRYLIGRHIGQLKARHQRLQPIFVAISLIDSVKFLQLFLAPYLRATAKSGDQIAAACCGDIRAAAGMMNRLLVGKELGPRLAIKGVLDQAAIVRRRWLPRLAQLFMSTPHATNRYLNLLAFFARVAPEDVHAWRRSLDEGTARRLTAALDASPHRRPPRPRPSPLSMLVATLVTGGLLAFAGWYNFAGPDAAAGGSAGGTNPASPAERQLLAQVPAGFAGTCTPGRAPVTGALRGADAAVTCQPRAAGGPSSVTYLHFQRPGTMRHAYQTLTRGLPPGNCMTTAGRGGYRFGSPGRAGGELACSASRRGLRVFVWTDRRLDVLSYAVSSGTTFAGLYQWWHGDSGPGPTPPGGKVTPPPPAIGIAGTLSAYFTGINARNYRQSWSQLSASNQATSAYSQFAAGESTTTIAAWKLHGITRGARPGTYTAFVTFQSNQDPAYAPNQSDSCDIWALDYTMIQRSGRWLIGQAIPHPGLPEYQAC